MIGLIVSISIVITFMLCWAGSLCFFSGDCHEPYEIEQYLPIKIQEYFKNIRESDSNSYINER